MDYPFYLTFSFEVILLVCFLFAIVTYSLLIRDLPGFLYGCYVAVSTVDSAI